MSVTPHVQDTLAALKADCETPVKPFTTRSWGGVLDAVLPPKRFVFGDLFACGQVQTMYGQGGSGKSRLSLNLARNQVLGLPFLDVPTGAKPVRHLFVGSENDIYRWKIDCACMMRGLTADDRDKLSEHIRLTTLEDADDIAINLGDPDIVNKWRATLKEWPPDILWVDPWGDVLEGDGFDRDVRSTIVTLRKLVGSANPDCGIVVLAHARTGALNLAQAVGFDAANFGKDSKALFSCSRAVINVGPHDQSETPDLVWAPSKNNNGKRTVPLRIRLDPLTLTYSMIEPLDVEAWLDEVKSAANPRRKKASVPFDDDAVLGLAQTLMTVDELHMAVREWGVTKDGARGGIGRLERLGKLARTPAGVRNKQFIGTPEAVQKFKSSQVSPED